MGGYKRAPKLYDLRWVDEPGLEVAVKPAPVGVLLEAGALAAKADQGDPGAVRTLLESMAACLHSWNLEDDNGPVPATYEGLAAQDMDLVMKILRGWQRAMAQVDTPLPAGLSNGHNLGPVPSIPMEARSSLPGN